VDGVRFFFDAGSMSLKKSNEKRQVVYNFRKAEPDGTLVFDVAYSEKNKSTRVDEILKMIQTLRVSENPKGLAKGLAKGLDAGLDPETLAKAFRVFEKQSEVDYFINKNARAFLQEQFELWLYQYLFAGQNVWRAERLAELQTLKAIAFKVIDFISQFEDELVKIWNKPKFVRDSHYVITLDKLSKVMEKIIAHPNFPAQVQEWRELGMLGADETLRVSEDPKGLLLGTDLVGAPLHPRYQFLPLDTKYFPDLELDILAQFDSLDAALDGWLVHSENYQALNTLLPKFRNLVNCIFIDPPYNTGSDDFIYKDNFQSASWLALIESRLQIAREWLNKSAGAIFIAIDENEFAHLKLAAENVFGQENFTATIIWQKVFAPKNTAKYFWRYVKICVKSPGCQDPCQARICA